MFALLVSVKKIRLHFLFNQFSQFGFRYCYFIILIFLFCMLFRTYYYQCIGLTDSQDKLLDHKSDESFFVFSKAIWALIPVVKFHFVCQSVYFHFRMISLHSFLIHHS